MHKKLYKAGKFWVATAVAIAGMTFSFCTASADSANVDSSSTTLSQSQNDNSAQSSSTQEGITSTNSTSTTNGENNGEQSNSQTGVTLSPRDAALAKYANEHVTGYIFSPDVSTANGGYNWFENGQLFSGFRYYMGTYYWFVDGVRQNEGWRQAWGLTYYTDADGRAVQGHHNIDGQDFYFGDDGSYYLRSTGYLYDGSSQNGGYRWYENGQLYTGFRYYMGTYYWFVDGVRQNE